MNFCSVLPLEISQTIFLYLDELQQLRLVSKNWKSVIDCPIIWTKLCSRPSGIPQLARNIVQLSNSSFNLYKDLRCLSQWYKRPMQLVQLAIQGIHFDLQASSTDHVTQSIIQTMHTSQCSFWSSVGSNDIDSNELLDYKLYDRYCLINQISVKPFRAQFQRGLPCYAPIAISFSFSFDHLFEHIHYETPVFAMENNNVMQTFHMKPIVISSYVRVNLIGRCTRQPGIMM